MGLPRLPMSVASDLFGRFIGCVPAAMLERYAGPGWRAPASCRPGTMGQEKAGDVCPSGSPGSLLLIGRPLKACIRVLLGAILPDADPNGVCSSDADEGFTPVTRALMSRKFMASSSPGWSSW